MQRMLLFAELSRLYEVGRGGDRKSEKIKDAKSASLIPKESVSEKTAREVGVSPSTIDREGVS